MSIKEHPFKRSVGPIAIAQDVKLCVKGAYVKVMEKSLITSGSTGQGVYVVYQLVWSVSARIVQDNPHVVEHLKHFIK